MTYSTPCIAALALWSGTAIAQPVSLECLEGLTSYTQVDRLLFSFDARDGYLAVQGSDSNVNTVQLWDISDPSSPSLFSASVNAGGFEPEVVTISYPLVAASGGRWSPGELRIFDFSDPQAPSQVGTVGSAVDLAEIVGQTLYLVENGSLKIFDLADPSQPSQLGVLPGVSPTALLADAGRIYLAGDAVRIVDVIDPSNPIQIGSFPAAGGGGIDRVGDTLFVTDNTGLLVLDITDPGAPTERSRVPLSFFRGHVEVIDGVAFVGGPRRGIARVDVSDPDAPQVLNPLTGPNLTGPVALTKDAGSLFALGLAGFSLVEADETVVGTSGLLAQTISGLLPANARVADARFSGGVGFFADRINNTLTLIDADPSGPAIIGTPIAIPFEPTAVELVDDVVFVGGASDQLLRFGVSDPANPVSHPALTMPTDNVTRMRVRDGRLLIASIQDGFAMYGVSDPAAPVLITHVDGTEFITDIDAEGDRLAIIWISQQSNYSPSYLSIMDISDPAVPVGFGTTFLGSWARSLALHDGFAFVVQSDTSYDFYYPGTLGVFDISVPGTPQPLSDIRFDDRANTGSPSEIAAMLVNGDRAYVNYRSGFSSGLAVIDISNPADLRLAAGSSGAWGSAVWLDADADTIYAPAGIQGFATYLNATCQPGCAVADIAEPFGELNFFDLVAFLNLYNNQDPFADFAAPFGVFNFFDVAAFVTAYTQGCL